MEPLLSPEGDVLATHTATLTRRVCAALFLIAPGLLGGILMFVTADADARAPLALASTLLIALGAVALAQQNKSKAIVRADGIEYWGLRGKLWALCWNEMAELHYRVLKIRLGGLLGLLLPALSTNVHLRFTDPNGRKYRLPVNLKAMDLLAERITEQQTTAHFTSARARLEAGEELQFGKSIALDKEKISTRKFFGGMKGCPLAEIERVSVESGMLRIRQRGKTFAFARVMAGAIPNVLLLLRLLEGMLGQKSALMQERDFASSAYVHG
jgi:hypothetical protein